MQHKFSKSLQALMNIKSKNDRSKIVRDLDINRIRLKVAGASLKNALDRWDYESINQDILDLKWSIQQAENLMSTPGYMGRVEKFTFEEAQTVVQQYNEEMKAVVKQYSTTLARLNKVVLTNVSEIQSISNELKTLEKEYMDVALLKNYLPENQRTELAQFPLSQVKKSNLVRVTAGDQVQLIIDLLKEMEVTK